MSKFVIVDCVTTFRNNYCVELNDDDPEEWACDIVVMEEAKEFSHEWLGEQIVSHRVLSSKEEAYKLLRKDNELLKDISDERITEIGITLIEDYTHES